MSETLNDPSNADAPTPIEPSGAIELTEREIAIAEGRDPDAPIEIPADDDASTPVEEVAEVTTESEPEPETWVQDYHRQIASTLGMDPEDLDDISSPEEFGRHVRHLQKVNQRYQTQTAPEPAKQAEPEYVDEAIVDGKPNVEYWRRHKDEFEGGEYFLAMAENQERLDKQIAEQAGKYESERQAREAEAQDRENERQWAAYHGAVDGHNPAFYGKSVDEFGNPVALTKEQEARRGKLFNETRWLAHRIAMEQQEAGMKVAIPSWQQLVKQAEPAEYRAEAAKRNEEKRLSDAKAQARNIRPAAGSSGAGHARRVATPSNNETVAEISQDPDVIAAWERGSIKR